MMTIDQLAPYVPALGDRIALINFCKRANGSKSKSSLFKRLKRKIKKKSSSESDSENDIKSSHKKHSHLLGNSYASKKNRRVDIGWQHFDTKSDMFKQVKEKTGGGVRRLEVNKDTKGEQLLKTAIDLFFPNGKSTHGTVSEVDLELKDFKLGEIDLNSSINDIYEATHVKLLRLYLCSKKKAPDDPELQKMSKPRSQRDHDSTKKEEWEVPKVLKDVSKDHKPDTTTVLHNNSAPQYAQILTLAGAIDPDSIASSCTQNTCSMISAHESDCSLADFSDLIVFGPSDTVTSDMLSETLEVDNVYVNAVHVPANPTHSFEDHENNLPHDPDSKIDLSLRVHRAKLIDDMIGHFKNPNILSLKFNFEIINEKGADLSGVSRDVYTSFWNDFFLRFAEGEDSRVPCLNSNWQHQEWKSVGRILMKGFKDLGYFPLQLAPAFVIALIFGENAATEDILLSSFMNFLSLTDRETISSAMENGLHGKDLPDDLLDILDQFGHNSIPAKEQIKHTFYQIAHKELIQKPKYALSCMVEVARKELKALFPTQDSVMEMYEVRNPTIKKVLNLLQAMPENNAERQSFRYLQQYIKSLNDHSKLRRFLQLATGADVICIDKIDIMFTKTEKLRYPVFHTCGPTLELPATYTSYPDLRGEFESILMSEKSFEMYLA